MDKIAYISSFILPSILIIFAICLSKSKCGYDTFTKGSLDGIHSSFALLPNLCLLIIGVNMFIASGATDILSKILAPVFDFLKIPVGLLPLIITRPLSSAASIAAYEGIISSYGIDSFEALCGAVIMGSTDTAVYVISVYFSRVKIRKTSYALPCAIAVSLFSVVLACAICRLFFV